MEQPIRVLVNPDNRNEELADVRRNQYTVNNDLKGTVLTALIHVHLQFAKAFNAITELYNLTAMAQITSHIATLHTAKRQTTNPRSTGDVNSLIDETLSIHWGTEEREAEANALETIMVNVFHVYGLNYSADNYGPNHWYGMMSPLLTFMTAFPLRMNEVRTGCDQFTVGKNENRIQSVRVNQYGLDGKHHLLLDGITYPPVKKSAMAQSVGPMTQLICLARVRGRPEYANKWKQALSKSLAHIPRVDEIIAQSQTRNASEVQAIFGVIADILLVTGSRSSNKAHFPFPFYLAHLPHDIITLMQSDPMSVGDLPPAYGRMRPPNMHQIDVSGKGAFKLYDLNANVEFKIYMNAPVETVRQIVFHSIWGSHWENLSILQYMTGVEFKTRRELGSAFRGKGSSTTEVTFKPIKILRYAKLSQALPTDYTTGGQQQIINKVVFAGKRTCELGPAMLNELKRHRAGITQPMGGTSLFNFLSNYRNNVYKRARSEGFIQQGVVDWKSTTGLTFTQDGNVVEGPPRMVPKLFMGMDSEEPLEDEEL